MMNPPIYASLWSRFPFPPMVKAARLKQLFVIGEILCLDLFQGIIAALDTVINS
jgi:hypothetical protein